MEQKFSICLDPGKYGWSFDSHSVSKKGHKYCVRIFIDQKMYLNFMLYIVKVDSIQFYAQNSRLIFKCYLSLIEGVLWVKVELCIVIT